jgi:hypothetical protein
LEILKWNLAKMSPSNKVDNISATFPGLSSERSMMRHPTIESLIGLAEGTLSPEDRQDVEDHMLNCARCFAEASEFLVVELQTYAELNLTPVDSFVRLDP